MLAARIAPGAGQLARLDQVAVLARQADRLAAGRLDRGHDLLVDAAGEHHLDDLDRGRVGDPQALDELALDLEAVEHRLDLRPAAVDHDRVDADLLEQHHVAREVLRPAPAEPMAWPPYLITKVLPAKRRM